jgi:hypothetical protein
MTEAGLAWYAYCVLSADSRPRLDGVAGVDPSFDVRLLPHRDLGAVVSLVRLQEFGAEALKQNLESLEWVTRVARAHNAVLRHVLGGHAVVPLRVCTLFVDEDSVRRVLERNREWLFEALMRLRGCTEWSVKVLAESPTPDAGKDRGARAAHADRGSGRAYFEQKKLQRTAKEESRARVERAVQEAHARLGRQAAAATVLPPQDRRISGHSGEMVLNGAYLVESARAAAFAALVEELGERHRRIGLRLELSGPFAPYNFVGGGELR